MRSSSRISHPFAGMTIRGTKALPRASRALLRATMATVLIAASILAMPLAGAAEYFTAKTGNDAADGRSEKTSFATIAKGVSVLKPGDTLTILPGHYFESVTARLSGAPEAPTGCPSETAPPFTLTREIRLIRQPSWMKSSLRYGRNIGTGKTCPSPWLSLLRRKGDWRRRSTQRLGAGCLTTMGFVIFPPVC